MKIDDIIQIVATVGFKKLLQKKQLHQQITWVDESLYQEKGTKLNMEKEKWSQSRSGTVKHESSNKTSCTLRRSATVRQNYIRHSLRVWVCDCINQQHHLYFSCKIFSKKKTCTYISYSINYIITMIYYDNYSNKR